MVVSVSKRKIDKLSKGELEDLKDAVIDDREEENEIEDEYEEENEETESSDSEDSDDVDSLGNVQFIRSGTGRWYCAEIAWFFDEFEAEFWRGFDEIDDLFEWPNVPTVVARSI